MTTAMPVDVQLAEQVRAPVREIEQAAHLALADVSPGAELCVRVVNAEEAQSLNAQYRNLDKPTNVLSFEAGVRLPDSDTQILGDIVICAPVVANEAEQQGKSLAHHYAHMVVHGVLHLAGFDHEHSDDARAMEQKEKAILTRLGIPDPYVDTSPEAADRQ